MDKSLLTPKENQKEEEEEELCTASIPCFLVLVCIMAASAGSLFGYNTGISGGVTSMDDFLLKFYPDVYKTKNNAKTDNYCKFDSQSLTFFTSLIFLVALISSFVASVVTRNHGRKPSILVGGLCFLTGAILDGASQNLAMLLVGRIVLGTGIGFANQAVPLYLSEIAPAKSRGIVTTMFQVAMSTGGVAALLVNSLTENISSWGWRLSLGLAVLPAFIVTIGFVFLPESPSSLLQRGHFDEGLSVLRKIRGRHDVQEEFNELFIAIELSNEVKSPWRNIIRRRYRPQLVMAFAIPFFQQVTGITIVSFYCPILFQMFGLSTNAALYSVIFTGVIGLIAAVITALTVDKFGRRKVFLLGGSSMFIILVVMGSILQFKLGAHNELSRGYGITCIVLIYVFCLCFGWSWAPLAWLVPSEIFPLEIRSAGQSISISVIMFFFFASSQTILSMLCLLKAATFYFFAGCVLVMTIFTHTLLPETKGVPLEETANLWKQHAFWRRYYE